MQLAQLWKVKFLNRSHRSTERCMDTFQVKHRGGNLALTTEPYLSTLLKVMLGLALASAQAAVSKQHSATSHQVGLHLQIISIVRMRH